MRAEEDPLIQFVHIGLPKSASTWLQDGFFNVNPNLDVVTRTGRLAHHRHLVHELFRRKNDHFDPADWRRRAHAELEPVLRRDRVRGLSDEELSGGMFNYVPRVLDKIREGCGTPKIVLVLREPRAFLRSAYGQYLSNGGTQSIDGFYHPGRCERLAARLDYRRLVEDLRSRFGGDRLLVLPFELLQREGESAFIAALCDFLGVPRIDAAEIPPTTNKRSGIRRVEVPVVRMVNALDQRLGQKNVGGWRGRPFTVLYSRVRRPLAPLLSRASTLPPPSSGLVLRIPDIERILVNDRFRFWSGPLERYNYDVEPMLRQPG